MPCEAVWRRDLSIKEGLSQLENSLNSSLFYSKVKRNPISSFNKTIITTIKGEIEANNLPANATNLIHLHPGAPTFYMLPKIQKQQTPVTGCPIVSSISCPTSQVAKFLDAILSPLVEQQPTYIKDLLISMTQIMQSIFSQLFVSKVNAVSCFQWTSNRYTPASHTKMV